MYQGSKQQVFLSRTALATAVSTAVLLAACGGGGGGGDTTLQSPAASATLSINVANAKPVAADALFGATSTDAAQAGAQFVAGVQVDTGSAATNSTLQLAEVAQVLARKVTRTPGLAAGVAISETVPCSSGSLSLSGEVSNDSAITAGDNVTIVANACTELVNGVSTTLNGRMTLRIVDGGVSSTQGFPLHVVMTIETAAFTETVNGKTTQTDGDLTLDLTANSSTSETLVVKGKSLSSRNSTSGRSYTLENYQQSISVNNGAATYSVTAQIDTLNPRLSSTTQVYFVSTPTVLTSSTPGTFNSGSLKVTGKGSALLLTVTGANTFKIDVDADGDGTFESSTTSTTTELKSLV